MGGHARRGRVGDAVGRVHAGVGGRALVDQQMSGALMWGLVMVVDSFWMMWVAAEWWSSEERRGIREDSINAGEQVSGSTGAASSD